MTAIVYTFSTYFAAVKFANGSLGMVYGAIHFMKIYGNIVKKELIVYDFSIVSLVLRIRKLKVLGAGNNSK